VRSLRFTSQAVAAASAGQVNWMVGGAALTVALARAA
jgi:hypothetical protein